MSETFDINKHIGSAGVFWSGPDLGVFERQALVRLGWDEGVKAFLAHLYSLRDNDAHGWALNELIESWETWAKCRFGEDVPS